MFLVKIHVSLPGLWYALSRTRKDATCFLAMQVNTDAFSNLAYCILGTSLTLQL